MDHKINTTIIVLIVLRESMGTRVLTKGVEAPYSGDMGSPCFTELVPPQSLMDSESCLTHHRCPQWCPGRFKREVFPFVHSEDTRGRGVTATRVCRCWCQMTGGRKGAQPPISVGKMMT